MLKDKLGRVIVQGDVLAYVAIDYGDRGYPHSGVSLHLATVVDGCNFALKLAPHPTNEKEEPWVVSSTAHMVIVKRGDAI